MTSTKEELKNRMEKKKSKGELKSGKKVLVYNGWRHPGGPHEATIVSVRGALEFSVKYEDTGDTYFEPCDNDFDFTLAEEEEQPSKGPLKKGQQVKVEGSEYVEDGRVGTIIDVDDTDPELPYLVLFEGYPRQKWLRASNVTLVEDSEDNDDPVSDDEYRPFIDILSEVVDGQHNQKVITTEDGTKFVVGKTDKGLGLCEYDRDLFVEATLNAPTLNGKAKVSKEDKETDPEDVFEQLLKELRGGE